MFSDLSYKSLTIPGYKLLPNPLHEGLSSTIYRAIRLADECPVVIKVNTQKALTEKKSRRIKHEFEIGKQVNSPYVIRYLEIKQDLSYGIALIMEDNNAVELTSVIPPYGFSNDEFLEIAIQIVQGLQAIHAANITHNDIKPSNILIQPTTKIIKIIDFNRASTMRQETEAIIPLMIGTLAYISPEQTGRVNRNIDYRTDFYSLGITFYQLLCGQLPFMANDMLGFIHQHLAKQPKPLHLCKPSIALPLSQMVMKLLAKEPENRYQSCEGILYDLNCCRLALREGGIISEFTLGQRDYSNKLTFSQYLYGRENEIKTLLQSFERVSNGKREVLMVAGQPGVGKSMLIQEVQRAITLKRGYFISGKFDQLNKNVAYSAISQAFDIFIKQLLTEDEVSIAGWKTRLLRALSSQAQLIVQVVPFLVSLIGQQPPATIANQNEAKTVFNLIFLEFVRVIANATHPLVIFLDDLQWADKASLELMTYLMQQPDLNYLLWVGTYRDTQVTIEHPSIQAIEILREAQVYVQTLTLAPLELTSLQQWIADSLHMPLTKVSTLAELIQQKTAGNPFFVKMFLQALYDERLLTFSAESLWQWDVPKICQHPATENVVALMIYQIQQLPARTQEALSMLSCLGHRLALNLVQAALACSQDDVLDLLQPALCSGILLQIDSEVCFAHDRVQEAAYYLLGEAERINNHLIIGKRLLALLPIEENLLFDTLAQLNHCRSLMTESQERLAMVRLNLQASQKAKQAIAYMTALNYLKAGQEWVNAELLWQTDYPLAFTIYKELAEVEYLNGHVNASQVVITGILPHLKSNLAKVEIYHLMIIQKILLGQPQEAITLGHQALQLLGSGLPADDLTEFIQRETYLFKQKLADRPLSSLLSVPLTKDPQKQAIFKILSDISSACYQIGSKLLPVITLMAVNLSLSEGHAPESCISYATYGLLLCIEYQQYALGYEFGNLAIQLAEKLRSPAQRCRSALFMFDFIYGWSKSIQDLPAIFAAEFDACLACGEIEYAVYCGAAKVHMLFDCSASLAEVQQQIISHLNFVTSTKTKGVIYNVMWGYKRVVANLIGQTQNEADFSWNNISEAKFEEKCEKSASGMSLALYAIRKAQVLYLYGQFEAALDKLDQVQEKLACIYGFYATSLFNWYGSLTRLALYPTVSPERQQTYLQQVIQNQQQMQKWQASCVENFGHKYFLVEAELARVRGHSKQARVLYDQAIDLAGQHGFIQEQALAAELAAKYWMAKKQMICAQGYLNTAFIGYKQWGAKRKLMQLKERHAELLHATAPAYLSHLVVSNETTLSGNSLRFLDLSSILKASQTLSSEIELPKLLYSIMQITIENAGAQQGALLFIEANDSIFVQAEYVQDGTITTLQNIPLINWEHGSYSVVEYVKKLHQSIVLDNATTDNRFKGDPYISRSQAKSILCIPLLKLAELKAILYLENNLMSHAFTKERVQTVQILTAQMLISLENARYFAAQIALTRQLAEQSARTQLAEESLKAVTHDYQLALEASQAGTWNWRIGTNNITWDATNYALFGLKPEEFKHTYAEVLERVHPEDRERFDQDIKRCLEQDIPHDIEFRVIWADGSEHMIAEKGRVYRDKNGQPIKMAGVCLDVTQRKQLEQERLQALKQAEEKEHLRAEEAEKHRKEEQEFVDTACHELRNPSSAINASVQFLKDAISCISNKAANNTKPVQQLEESTGIIELSINHIKNVLNDVLKLSQLKAGKISLAHKPFQPKAVLEETLRMLVHSLTAKHLDLKLSLPEQAVMVKGDPDRFKIILINLLSNAIKFTDQGYVKVSLQMQNMTSNQEVITLEVEDTGKGISKEQQARLFERFYCPSSSQYDEGSGLGLSITKRIVDLMGGTIRIESEEGKGAKFIVQLTLESLPLEEKVTPSVSKEPTKSKSPTSPIIPKRILIVEDNLANQKILQKQLQKVGHHCSVANNGLEALEKYQSNTFDILLMDIMMPVMTGVEATKRIRAIEKQTKLETIPIIGISANAREELAEEYLSAGMNDYLTKPYKVEELYDLVNKWTLALPKSSPPGQQEASKKKSVLEESSSAQFWSSALLPHIPIPAIWMAEPLRQQLYPCLDRLSEYLYSLGIQIPKPGGNHDKISKTGWQLYSLIDKEEHWAVLNLNKEADVDKLIELIQQSKTRLQAQKMLINSTHVITVSFSTDTKLDIEIDGIIKNLSTPLSSVFMFS